jgi:hypothetical protein
MKKTDWSKCVNKANLRTAANMYEIGINKTKAFAKIQGYNFNEKECMDFLSKLTPEQMYKYVKISKPDYATMRMIFEIMNIE